MCTPRGVGCTSGLQRKETQVRTPPETVKDTWTDDSLNCTSWDSGGWLGIKPHSSTHHLNSFENKNMRGDYYV